MKKLIISLCSCFCCFALMGQETQKTAILPSSHQVIAPITGAFQNADMTMSFVMGETAVGSKSDESEEGVVVLQGFQHPSIVLLGTAIEDIYIESIRIYPNPVAEQVFLDFPTEVFPEVQYSIIDVKGQVLENGSAQTDQAIDVSDFVSGIYLLSLQTSKGELIGTYKLQKSE